jgi:hypothetical protein
MPFAAVFESLPPNQAFLLLRGVVASPSCVVGRLGFALLLAKLPKPNLGFGPNKFFIARGVVSPSVLGVLGVSPSRSLLFGASIAESCASNADCVNPESLSLVERVLS